MYYLKKLRLSLSLFLTACSQITITQQKLPSVSVEGINRNMPNCKYSAEAVKVGIYHFQFPEVSEGDLVTVEGYKVHKIMSEPLQQMLKEARVQGVNLKIASAFRSVKHQQNIIQRKKMRVNQLSKSIFSLQLKGFWSIIQV